MTARPVAAIALVLALAGAASRSTGASLLHRVDVSTKFAWSGHLELDETIWLVGGGGCTGKIAVDLHQVVDVRPKSYVAQVDDPRKGVWEMTVAIARDGAPQVAMNGALTCAGQTTRVSGARLQAGYSKTGTATFRYDARKQKLEVVPAFGHPIFITGAVTSPGFAGREIVVSGYGLPRLELHPPQETSGDFRAHSEQATRDTNTVKIKNAQYIRALDAAGGGGFAGSPITSFLGFYGHVPSVGPGYQFKERVRSTLLATVFGPDSDGDRVNDGADTNAFDADSDNDGFPDYWEALKGTSPVDKSDHPSGRCCTGAPDSDHDGHSDPQEVAGASDPNDPSSVPKAAADTAVSGGGSPPPPTDWYGFTISSVKCVNDGEVDGAPMAHARVVLHMWVVTKSGLTSTHLVTNMRWRARLELPVGLHYSQTWQGGSTPYLTDGRHDIDETINTTHQIRDATTDGGQPWRVHVQLTWDRPTLTDIDKNFLLAFDTKHCLAR